MFWPLSRSFFLLCFAKGVFSPVSLAFCITMLLITDYLVVTCLLLCTSNQLILPSHYRKIIFSPGVYQLRGLPAFGSSILSLVDPFSCNFLLLHFFFCFFPFGTEKDVKTLKNLILISKWLMKHLFFWLKCITSIVLCLR